MIKILIHNVPNVLITATTVLGVTLTKHSYVTTVRPVTLPLMGYAFQLLTTAHLLSIGTH